MTSFDIFLQQAINGLSLGAMYSLLALGFTLVYGIAELINFAHFNVFMVGAMNFPNPLPPIAWHIGGAVLRMKEVLIWAVALILMGGLTYFVRYTRLGKAMRATAQDPEAARMMGVEVDRVVMTAFFLGSALAGASGMIFGLYYNLAKVDIGFAAGLRAFTAAVLGGIGNVPGAMLGGVLIGLIEAASAQLVGTAWSDVIIFGLLVVVLTVQPSGLLGRLAPNKS